jgi:hypothetical protein
MGHAPEGSAKAPDQRAARAMIAVVHLVWGPLGAARLRSFISSYRRYPAGVEHDLVILLNGVDHEMRGVYDAELDGVDHRLVSLPHPLQDLAAYAWAAESLHYDRYCFLNSYSVILSEHWLAKLDAALEGERIGLAGASGSWGSFHSAALDSLHVPNPYRRAAPRPAPTPPPARRAHRADSPATPIGSRDWPSTSFTFRDFRQRMCARTRSWRIARGWRRFARRPSRARPIR